MMIGTLKNINFEEDNFYFHDYKIKNISKIKKCMILELGDISISFIKTINETIKNPKNFLILLSPINIKVFSKLII